MKGQRVAVAPDVLVWARRAIGMDLAVAARRLGLSRQTLQRLEAGDLNPTLKQLRKAAAAYRVPLAVLLLPKPPTTFQPIRDFRRLKEGKAGPWSPALHSEVRRAQMQREVFLEISELAPDSIRDTAALPQLSMAMAPEVAGSLLREYLGISIHTQLSWRTPNEALNGWVDIVEQHGILVVQATHVPVDEARGFSISELPFPAIGLNGADWPRPRVFTLLHELAHLGLNLGGLCDLHETRRTRTTDADHLEHFCNAVAAAAIVPAADLLAVDVVRRNPSDYGWPLDDLALLADRYMISSEATLLRLVTLERASWDVYWQRKPELEGHYVRAKEDQKRQQAESGGGPSYYVVKARDIGHGYAHAVLDAYRSRAISSLDVSDYLQVKYNQIAKLESVLR